MRRWWNTASRTSEDVLFAAFYDEKLLAPLRDPVPEWRPSTTLLHELVRWLHDRRDIQRGTGFRERKRL